MKTESTYYLIEEALSGLDETQKRSMQDTWDLCGRFAPVAASDQKSELKARVMQSIQQDNHSPVTDRPALVRPIQARPALRLVRSAEIFRSFTYQAVAVAAAIVVAVSIILSPDSDHYRIDPGSGTELVSLSDGSSVLLAPGSRLTVPEAFGKQDRDVVLHGEAFFNVAEGSKPFKVKTLDASTTVLGTSFNVRSWPGSMSEMTQVIVETGRVSVAVSELETIVEPGQALTASQAVLTPVDTNPEARLAWRNGGFSYDNELIGTIIEDVERRFDVSIKAPASIRLRPITIHRNHVDDASEFIGDIAATISVRFRPTANGYEMYLD